MLEGFAPLHRNFFQGFQAVGRKTGANDIDACGFGFPQFREYLAGIGFEPLGLAEARLESDPPGILRQLQGLGKKAPGLQALAMVGVALVEGKAWQPVKTHDQYIRFAPTLGPLLAD